MQHGLIKNPKDNKPFLLGKNITITKSDLNDAKVKKMIFKKKVIVDKSEKKMLLPDMTATKLDQNHGLKQNVEKESQKYEILPNLMQRQIHQQNLVQKINTKPIFLGDNITITKSVPYKTGNLKNLLKPVKKATKNTRTESPKREILPDLPENSPKNSFETHENNLLLQKPNQEKTGLIGNDIIILKSEPDTKVNQFENNSLMSVKKKHPEEQPRKIESKNQIPSVHDKKRPSDAKKPHKCSICSFACSTKQYLQNHIMKKHGLTAHERKNLFHSVIKNNDSLQKQISDPLPFDCNSCWSRFASKPDLDQHNISAHQNKKQFKCNPCKVGFTSKQALNQHISSTHQGKKLTEQWKNQIASLLTSED